MSDALATYLHDHFAGATFGIDLLKRLIENHQGDPLGRFGVDLLLELQEDKATLERLIGQARVGTSDLKQGAAWLGEKVSRLKLSTAAGETFGSFESLELLSLGILGKLKLWQALAAAAGADPRLSSFDFDRLAARAEEQHKDVESHRIAMARAALAPKAYPAET